MLQKLEEVEARYEELNRQLADPDVIQKQDQFRALTQEHREVEKVVTVYRDYKKVLEEIAGNKEIMHNESDSELIAMAKEEMGQLEERAEALMHELNVLLLPKDPNDDKNVIVEIRAGTGGDEAAIFVGDLFRMYSRYAEEMGWKVQILSQSEGSQGGFKEIIAMFEGDSVYSHMKFESGVHRVQRVPATESQGRIHTSAVTVAVLPEADDVDVEIDDKDLRVDVYRASGAGGQHVNRTESAVRITHIPSGIVAECQDERSQHKNRARAMKVLRSRLLDQRQAEQDAEQAEQRRGMVKTGDRSEKVRTYNFPQDRLTDHRIGLTVHNLPGILGGEIGNVISSLVTHYQAEALKGVESNP